MRQETTLRVRFKATPENRTWVHKKAAIEKAPFGSGSTTRVRPPVILNDGDVIHMTQFEWSWCETKYPKNFVLVDGPVDTSHPDFSLDECSYAQLRAIAKAESVSTEGKEDVLRERLRLHFEEAEIMDNVADSGDA